MFPSLPSLRVTASLALATWLTSAVAVAAPSEDQSHSHPSSSDTIQDASSFEELEAATSGSARAAAHAIPSGQGSRASFVELSGIFDFAGAYFSTDEPLQSGAHDPDHTGFNLQKFEVSVAGAVDPYFKVNSHIVFGADEIDLEEVYATTLGLPLGLQIRFGKFLTRFGRINGTHLHAWDFVDQPFQLGRLFGGEGSRGVGGELSALLPLPWAVEVIASATEASGEESARSFYGAKDVDIEGPEDLLYTLALKQFFPLSSSWSLAFGLSGAFGPNADGRRTDIYGADLYLKYRPLDRADPPVVALQSEWFYRRRQIPQDLIHDFGGYAQALYRFAPRWSAAARYEYGSPAYGDALASVADPLDPEWTSLRRRYSANFTFYPSEFSRLRLQANRDVPGSSDAYWAFFLAAEVAVGAHGGHQF